MAKKWSEVANSPEFKALSPSDQEGARRQYFDEVIVPQLPESEIQSARAQFDADTAPQSAKPSRTYRPSGDAATFSDAGEFVTDFAKATNAALKGGIAALGQMVEKPLAAGVNAVADKLGYQPVLSGQAFTGLGQRAEAERPANPIADLGGQTAVAMLPMGAATRMAPGAPFVERMGRAGAAGGAGAMAMEPVLDDSKNFLKEKLKQGGRGALYSLALGGATEGLLAGGDLARRLGYGIQSDEARKLWDRAKDLGFSIRPEQTRADSARVSQSGLSHADKLQNADAGARMVSEKTGNPSHRLTEDWFDDTFRALGAKYDQVYKPGTRLRVDKSAIDELQQLVDFHRTTQPFMSRKAVDYAEKLIGEFNAQVAKAGQAKVTSVMLPADMLQHLRGSLRHSASITKDRMNAHAMYEAIDAFDGSIERNHPALASILSDVRPKYQSLLALEHGRQSGFVDKEGSVSLEGLGKYLLNEDSKVVRGTSRHPLAEAGKIGETFGIRSLGEASTVPSGRLSGSGDEQISPTRYSMWRLGVQQAKRLPGVRADHENYLKFGGGYRPENVSPYSLSGALMERNTDLGFK